MSGKNHPFGPCDILDDGSVIIQDGDNPVLTLEVVAEAYHEFAKAGVAALKKSTWFRRSKTLSAAYMALPVLFNYRHALELYLKAIVLAGKALLGPSDVPNEKLLYSDHSLEKLRPYVERVFEALGWNWNFEIEGLRSVADFRRLIGHFDAFDSDSTKSRYPINTKGGTAWKDWRQVNVFAISAALDPILEKLRWVAGIVDEAVSERARAEAEAREALGDHDYDG